MVILSRPLAYQVPLKYVNKQQLIQYKGHMEKQTILTIVCTNISIRVMKDYYYEICCFFNLHHLHLHIWLFSWEEVVTLENHIRSIIIIIMDWLSFPQSITMKQQIGCERTQFNVLAFLVVIQTHRRCSIFFHDEITLLAIFLGFSLQIPLFWSYVDCSVQCRCCEY